MSAALDWISVETRLPDAETPNCSADCLISFGCKDDPSIGIGYFYLNELKGNKAGDAFNYESRRNVDATHWMPLPPAPAA